MEHLMENATILVVDDNPTNVKLVCNILKKEGYNLAVAMNGQDALEIVDSNPIDLVLLDIMMPGMDGYEVCQLLKAKEATKEIPVIFISALSDLDDITRSYDVGGVDFITKPVKEREVIQRVKTQLELVQARRILQKTPPTGVDSDLEYEDGINVKENFMLGLLPDEDQFKKHFNDSFVLNVNHKSLPLGFHWLNEHKEYVLLVLVDSRNKDVPGISFNVIGLTLLNQLPIHEFSDKAKDILHHLLPAYVKTLNAFGQKTLTGDDISIGVVAYNRKQNIIHYSGNRQTCIIFPEHLTQNRDVKSQGLLVNDGDITVSDGFRLYLLSDGIAGQKNGKQSAGAPDHFTDKLEELQPYTFSEQKSILRQKITESAKDRDHHNNLTVIGIEFHLNHQTSNTNSL